MCFYRFPIVLFLRFFSRLFRDSGNSCYYRHYFVKPFCFRFHEECTSFILTFVYHLVLIRYYLLYTYVVAFCTEISEKIVVCVVLLFNFHFFCINAVLRVESGVSCYLTVEIWENLMILAPFDDVQCQLLVYNQSIITVTELIWLIMLKSCSASRRKIFFWIEINWNLNPKRDIQLKMWIWSFFNGILYMASWRYFPLVSLNPTQNAQLVRLCFHKCYANLDFNDVLYCMNKGSTKQ